MQFSDLARQHNRQSSLMEAERCGAESARRRTLYFRGKRRGVVGRQSVHLVSSGSATERLRETERAGRPRYWGSVAATFATLESLRRTRNPRASVSSVVGRRRPDSETLAGD
jgi:hypothetical protein